MRKASKNILVMMLSATLASCAATSNTRSTVAKNPPSAPSFVKATQTALENEGVITLEKIMSDPDWIGRQPLAAYWADDSKAVYYQRKQQGSPLRDLFHKPLNSDGNGEKVTLETIHAASYSDRVLNTDKTKAAWTFQGNLFVKELNSGNITQLTRDGGGLSNIRFLNDGNLAYQKSDTMVMINLTTGLSQQLASWRFAEKPQGVKAPKDYIAEQQVKLIKFVEKQRADRQTRFDYKQELQKQNTTLTAQPFYFDDNMRTVEASLSPDARFIILSIEKDEKSRGDNDIMPNYINEDGRIKSEEVRRRVADSKPEHQKIWLLDLEAHTQSELSYKTLPGYNEDVLEAVKTENAKAKGETYTTNRLPRDIGLIVDWYWDQSAIQWHSSGKQVAIMLEAWDNKDRWIATVDFDKKQLVSQHRMHDDAWISYKFNSFGWLNNKQKLYYLSEESGYAQLYSKPINGKSRALTSGKFEVDYLQLTADDQYIYYQANKKHPGMYEIYRVDVSSGESEAITDMGGMNRYSLSPDESTILINHSELLMPPELYAKSVAPATKPVRLTHTVSEEFLSLPWTAPDVVAVESSYADAPVYSKVYRPKTEANTEKRRAVIFSHGAGYLQNSHLGWSSYFREFMFHSMLAQQGYVVMDMDYRASMGYGRDWRTAIYRQMGTPEVEDLRDGVNWLVDNANVDRQRIGTYGGSYGGFMTFMALFNAPDLFKAGAALRPVTDWAHYNHGYTSNILNTPDVDPIAYEKSSPLYFAEGLQESLLINAPMVDNNVFFVDTVRLVQRLIELEKEDFETAIYPVEPHGFRQPSSWLNEYRKIYKLFEEEL